MLRVHLQTGQTTTYDLSDDRQARDLLALFCSPEYQETVSGVTIALNGSQYSLTRPKGYRGSVVFQPERVEEDGRVKGGERLTCYVGDTRLTLMVHNSDSVRVSLARVGNQIYNPVLDG